ncbi:MAG: hypothetical protein Q4G24_02780 [Paracoccus sp. (in: a-proteobacteria)]|uniref:hypothetical protein n=1 Tax=Paracoccus sp. TaxID=267 RepID=UPI0026DF4CE9|nr:hypothetical protein [Paracoccus sp. (in: a-proteobacteria)]MDO5620377.1 hypothetical protein [Paracoccus sp. (in: a-proteobacteria)]
MRFLFLTTSLLLPLPALAGEWACHFQTECQDLECEGTAYDAEISVSSDNSPAIATLTDPVETVEMTSETADLDRLRGTYAAADRLLTVDAGGEARYTVHFATQAMAITYLGRCEEIR